MDNHRIPIASADIRKLIDKSGDPCVSIYLDLSSTQQTAEQCAARLGNLLGMARRMLTSRGVANGEIDELLADLQQVADNRKLVHESGLGMALFTCPGHSASFELSTCPVELVVVNSLFLIRPLLEQPGRMAEDAASPVTGLDEFRRRQEDNEAAATDDLLQILEAARSGVVETLFITSDCRILTSGRNLSEELRNSYSGMDLANLAAIWTLENGGEVMLSTEAELGAGVQMLAGLRQEASA